MTSESESTLINPGEKFRPDGTFNKDRPLAWCELRDEETRRVKDTYAFYDAREHPTITDEILLSHAERQVALGYLMYLVDGTNFGPGSSAAYLDYNGEYQGSPVNQVPFLREWKPFVARSAHEFDWTMAAHSLAGLSDNEIWTVQHQMYGLIAAPWYVMFILEATDPTTELNGNVLWKTYQADAENVLEGLCHECDNTATFARLFAHKANLELVRGALVSGKVHETDRTLTPWGLSDNIVTQVVASIGETPTAEKIAQFHRQNRMGFLNALHFYATDVGTAERPHSHD